MPLSSTVWTNSLLKSSGWKYSVKGVLYKTLCPMWDICHNWMLIPAAAAKKGGVHLLRFKEVCTKL